ncbi:DUF58 domain-containing protein [Ascidiimonas aurantiaca]|uniref:DUF58 domain-containing protein n=1 Tax=Ascidiimonas aurantiaca TaxID=1685432 RepID=UPI0030EB929D
MLHFIKAFYFCNRFFKVLLGLAFLFLLSYWFKEWYAIIWLGVMTLVVAVLIDILLLFIPKSALKAHRHLPDKFSNSDENPVPVTIQNLYNFKTEITVIDELPVQFQKRDFRYVCRIGPGKKHDFEYLVRPLERGVYTFGKLNVYVTSPLGLIKRRYHFLNEQEVLVYPSFIQMQKYDFLAISQHLTLAGLKKIRKIGHTTEFEQIKEYIPGEDFRTVNWKATAKRSQLMVNQYQDERSQPVYSFIDTGRAMKMPFNELKLLDYAINSTLAFTNVALKKHDKAGMLSFDKTVDHFVPALQKSAQLHTVMEHLYNIDTQFPDADFGYLYAFVRRKISHRSLLMLYTNFEHISALKRQLPYLKGIAQKHLLIVIFFENTQLQQLVHKKADSLQEIYHKALAQKFTFEKRLMQQELLKCGIQTILTAPENLTINAINKYLEVKARGML